MKALVAPPIPPESVPAGAWDGKPNNQDQEKKGHVTLWPPIHFQRGKDGRVYYVVDLGRRGTGKRQRFVCPTKTAAEIKAAKARAARADQGNEVFEMETADRADAVRALRKLKPFGALLADAADHFVKHVLAYRNAPLAKDIVATLLKAKEKQGRRRPRTLQELESRLGHFVKMFGERQLADITLEEIQDYVSDPTLSARSCINRVTKLAQLWNFAIGKKWADLNLMDQVERPEAEDSEPGILTVLQCNALLNQAERHDLLPFVALGLFAGLRNAELLRLNWSAVRFPSRSIRLDGKVTKKRSRRVVEINDTLFAWLAPYAMRKGPVVAEGRLRQRFDALRKAAADVLREAGGVAAKEADGLENWPHNGLRHSFGSYHLALHGDAIKTANQMGHRDTTVLDNHYKALVEKPDAERFWALRPAGAANAVAIGTA